MITHDKKTARAILEHAENYNLTTIQWAKCFLRREPAPAAAETRDPRQGLLFETAEES